MTIEIQPEELRAHTLIAYCFRYSYVATLSSTHFLIMSAAAWPYNFTQSTYISSVVFGLDFCNDLSARRSHLDGYQQISGI